MPVSTPTVVVDTNVVVYLLLPGEYNAITRELFRKTPHWAAPLLWRSELRAVLTRYAKNGHIPLQSALQLQHEAEGIFAGREFAVDSGKVLELAAASGCSAYDCEFVMIAKVLGVPLVTNDAQVLRAFPETAVTPAQFVRAA